MTIQYRIQNLGDRGVETTKRLRLILLQDGEVREIARNVAYDLDAETYVQNNLAVLWDIAEPASDAAIVQAILIYGDIALPFASDILMLLIAVMQADISRENLNTRYARIAGVIENGVSNGFRAVFNDALEAKTTISIADLLTLTAAKKRDYITHAEAWATRYAWLITARRLTL